MRRSLFNYVYTVNIHTMSSPALHTDKLNYPVKNLWSEWWKYVMPGWIVGRGTVCQPVRMADCEWLIHCSGWFCEKQCTVATDCCSGWFPPALNSHPNRPVLLTWGSNRLVATPHSARCLFQPSNSTIDSCCLQFLLRFYPFSRTLFCRPYIFPAQFCFSYIFSWRQFIPCHGIRSEL